MNINQILGEYEKRYFGLGHKQTDYEIIEIIGEQSYKAKITQNGLWSQKGNGKQVQHLSTLDAIILTILAFQCYYFELDLEKYFLKSFSVISGRKAVEGLESVCVEIFAVTVLADFSIEVKSEVEGMKVNLFFSTSTVNHNQDKNPGVNLKDYYSNHLKNRKHQLKHIKFLSDTVVAGILSREETGKEYYSGLGHELEESVSLLEWLIIFSQFAQSLIYYHDDIDRESSNTLWMKSVKAEMIEPQKYDNSIPLIGEIDNFKQIERLDKKWHIFHMSGSDVSNQVKFSAKLAHLL